MNGRGYGSSMYGGGGYGSSMYGGGYGSSMYGSSMYGRGGTYGSSMYGGGGMNGGGMYGQRQGDSEFFTPKVPQEEVQAPNRLKEAQELNTSFLESLHTYGTQMCRFAQHVLTGMVRLHKAIQSGTLSPAAARRATAFAIATAAIFVGAVVRGVIRRRQKRLVWDTIFARTFMPLYLPLGNGVLPNAAL